MWDDRFPSTSPRLSRSRADREAGADIIGIDATPRPVMASRWTPDRPHSAELGREGLCRYRHAGGGAGGPCRRRDLCRDDAAGYTEETASRKTGPDLGTAVRPSCGDRRCPSLRKALTPELVAEAFRRGAHAVVVGTAITNPREITKKFVQAAYR